MNEVAALIADMVRAGVDADLVGRTAAALAAREPVAIRDETAERKRTADRDRMRQKREESRATSRDSSDIAPLPSPEGSSPIPPSPKPLPSIPPSPPKGGSSPNATPRQALLAVLDAEHADALLDHRQRIRKPLTLHAAKLLAAKFAKVGDPNAAADTMIAGGWQGFEPEWIDNRMGRQATAPPRKTTHANMWTEEAKAFGLIDEPGFPANRRLEGGLSGGQDQGFDLARRIASS